MGKSIQRLQQWSNDGSIHMFSQSVDDSRWVGGDKSNTKCRNNFKNKLEKDALQQNVTQDLCMWR